MSLFDSITVPTLLLDEARARRNIQRMADKARESGVRFRPHFKTHQSAQVSEWMREYGVTAITVSSLRMASYFADHGWDDITVAFPVNLRELDTINRLAKQIHLGVLVDSFYTAEVLTRRIEAPLDVWIEIDAGDHRTGVAWDSNGDVLSSITAQVLLSSRLTLRGLLTHTGYAYGKKSLTELEQVYYTTVERMTQMRDFLQARGVQGLQLSVGDTPTCSVVERFSGVDEIRPGNFVYYDVMQSEIGSCSVNDIAIALACPVVSKQPDRQQIVVYGGGVHLSKDYTVDRAGRTLYGLVALPTAQGWSEPLADTYMRSLSQEHGVIQTTSLVMDKINIGDLVLVLPVHACMTADLMKQYVLLTGEAVPMLNLNTL